MKWSFKIARVFGIEIRLHLIFILLLLWIGLDQWSAHGPAAASWTVGRLSLLFVFVLLHEIGHSLVAKRYGVRVQDIVLTPIGGMSRMSNIPENPNTELKIAVCGPAVNVLIAAVLMPVFFILTAWYGPATLSLQDMNIPTPPGIVLEMIAMNMILALFNVLPVFPMDGGRILRATLAKFFPYVTATRIAAGTGRTVAIGALAVGFILNYQWMLNQPLLIIIAAFIYMAGWQEQRMVEMQHAPTAPGQPIETTGMVLPDNAPPTDDATKAFGDLAQRLEEIKNRGQAPR